jgi:hypothetical protein
VVEKYSTDKIQKEKKRTSDKAEPLHLPFAAGQESDEFKLEGAIFTVELVFAQAQIVAQVLLALQAAAVQISDDGGVAVEYVFHFAQPLAGGDGLSRRFENDGGKFYGQG